MVVETVEGVQSPDVVSGWGKETFRLPPEALRSLNDIVSIHRSISIVSNKRGRIAGIA